MNIKTELCGLPLDNPIIPASGTFGFGQEYKDFYDLNILGSISIKGTTREARFGNPTPRIAECKAGMLNAVGLQNPGVKAVVDIELPELKKIYLKPIVANVCGFSLDEYVEVAQLMSEVENVGWIELNVSCPNVKHGGMSFGTDACCAAEVTSAVKAVSKKPVIVKLSPNVTDITEIALACQEAGADGLCLINTLLGMRLDLKNRKPLLANVTGGFSGDAVFPIALRMIYQTAKVCKIPIIGCGGVSTARDVIEMMMAGASAVQVGSANLINPFASKEIIEAMPKEMKKLGIQNLTDIIGVAL
ncbi:dihydroorotate dehydrogenase [Porphyromonadaceae bacterium COT-184 OH4590]|nr:dihydroorotate dehydrogenase [Porphyromonadaceae bacterium COT-184 OH4590]MDO4726726.1 dihydroorotate dehydrogenase [Porphyromonadaceae bacterium]